MAKTTSFLSQTSGKLDDQFQTRSTDHGTFLSRMPRKRKSTRSEKQANMRCQMPNAAAMYQLFDGKLKEGFEGKNPGVNDFNAFVQANYGKNPVFITKQESMSGACVLGNYQYSRGSLPAIGLNMKNGVLQSTLKLGSLTIDATTTVGALSDALMRNNAGWLKGDQLTFFYAEQWLDSEDVPRVTMDAWKMVVDPEDTSLLWSTVWKHGFSAVTTEDGNVLGMGVAMMNAGASWIHSRNKADGSTQVSTQRMRVVSDILEDYQGYDAMIASAQSYGGINTKDVYLNPGSLVVTFGDISGSADSGSGSGGAGGNTGGSGSGTGNDSGSGTGSGGNTGGGTGNEEPGGSGTGGGGTDPDPDAGGDQ